MGCGGSSKNVVRLRPGWDKDTQQIEELLVETKVDNKPNLDLNYVLKLNKRKTNHKEFIRR